MYYYHSINVIVVNILFKFSSVSYIGFFDRYMITIGILESLAGDVIMDLIHQKIETEVQEITKENFGEHHVSALEKVIMNNLMHSILLSECVCFF